MSSDTHHVAAYPTTRQYERWQARADDLGYKSYSQFVQDMTEAGIKADRGFDTTVANDESAHELRRQRNDLREELERARERIQHLEERVFHSERATVVRFLEDNPGASYEAIVEHIKATIPERMTHYLDGVYREPDGYYVSANGGD